MRKAAILGAALLGVFLFMGGLRVLAQGEEPPVDPCKGATPQGGGKCGQTFTHAIKEGRPDFSFLLVWTVEASGGPLLETMTITDPSRPDFSQVLVFTGKDFYPASIDLEFVDLNFDGGLDLDLLVNNGASNEEHAAILYDPAADSFVLLDRTFWNLSVDAKKQMVYSNTVSGCAGNNYELVGYRIEGLNPVPVRGEKRKEIAPGCMYYEDSLYKFTSARPTLVAERIVAIYDLNTPAPVVLLGPLAPPLTVAPAATVIRFLSAEENMDPQAMAALYANKILWHDESKTRDQLKQNHSAYLASLAEYDFTLSDFKQTMSNDNKTAVVENNVKAAFKTKKGKAGSFELVKRFRLIKSGEDWLIDCEEDAAFFDGATGKTTNACVMPTAQ